MGKPLYLVGQKFFRLEAIDFFGKMDKRRCAHVCICDCGNLCLVESRCLVSGNTKSCGCYNRDKIKITSRTHGKSKTRIYWIWHSMLSRCRDPRNKSYNRYGARGIDVCNRWQKFENFYKDMGDRPEGKSLERLNNSLGYSPSNCIWADAKTQNNNKRNNKFIFIDGEKIPLKIAAKRFGIKYKTMLIRLQKGWSDKDIAYKKPWDRSC